ncbi:hypothetical protein BGZ63DRAFT_424950 [Mariannaea sp. PMI_226]|nr:hypothetical protein BGZ63DRAFT_424950 [Mariannaea sp. PMI_226]
MKPSLPAFLFVTITTTITAFYTVQVHAPENPDLHGRGINARYRRFIIGAASPSTYCGSSDRRQCPPGNTTLVNGDMTFLAASVPGGQFIYVDARGAISYPSAHSSLRPPGSKIGGFRRVKIESNSSENLTVLSWQPDDDDRHAGLWACPTSLNLTTAREAELRATTARFWGRGCKAVAGLRIRDAGDEFAAWAYT